MSFDRYRAQTFCEGILGCADFTNFYLKTYSDIENITLDNVGAFTLSSSLKEDARDLYFKGCISLSESLDGFQNRNYSWAVIKSYYAVFYLIKADFALRDHALIRHKCIYYLHARVGMKPVTKGRIGTNRSNYTGDHKAAINYYCDLFSGSDILLSQNIDGMNCYHWLMKKREQVNYQERYFSEPNYPQFLEFINNQISTVGIDKLLQDIYNDTMLRLTFQQEYAPIAIPIWRAILTKQNFENNGITNILSPDQLNHLTKFTNPFN